MYVPIIRSNVTRSWQRAAGLVLTAVLACCVTTSASSDELPVDAGSIESTRGCELRYRVHHPDGAPQRPVALIAHGFMRTGESMDGWAEAFAAIGVTSITVDLCASWAPEGRHADNAIDLVKLRRALGIEDAIYVGVSAGGLAALIAAAQDPEATRALLLLDPVNAGGQARAAAGRVRAPVAAFVAKPQMCNAWRNIDRALDTLRDATIIDVDSASHCDFEWPSDSFCRVACMATNGRDQRRRIEARVRSLGVRFVQAIVAGNLEGWKSEIGPEAR